MKKMIIIGFLAVALLGATSSVSFAWWNNDMTIINIQQNSNLVRVTLQDGTATVQYNLAATKVNEMLAMLLTAQSSGLTVDADISGADIITLRVK